MFLNQKKKHFTEEDFYNMMLGIRRSKILLQASLDRLSVLLVSYYHLRGPGVERDAAGNGGRAVVFGYAHDANVPESGQERKKYGED